MALRSFFPSTLWDLTSVLCALLFAGTIPARAQTETILYSFTGGSDGSAPSALVRRGDKLYGTTLNGGASGNGTVFQISTNGKEKLVHSFNGSDGQYPNGALILDKEGNLYGTTGSGGAYDAGTVFTVSPSGVEKVLYNFTGGSDGDGPRGALVLDKEGNLYGATSQGGAYPYSGTVFKLSPSGDERVLYNFTGGADGGNPNGGLVIDTKDNLYGTTFQGGVGGLCAPDCGVVFSVSSSGTETVLYAFDGQELQGFGPTTGLVRDKAGNLYGTTFEGGADDRGVVYEVTPSGSESVLLSFDIGNFGYSPEAPLILDKDGNLYGTTTYSAYPTCDCGGVFELIDTWDYVPLYQFQNEYHPDGAFPVTGLTFGTKGRLYGTTSKGGVYGYGTVFELTP
jgi:uncharacterized repeat protein (TIGR03803 family)